MANGKTVLCATLILMSSQTHAAKVELDAGGLTTADVESTPDSEVMRTVEVSLSTKRRTVTWTTPPIDLTSTTGADVILGAVTLTSAGADASTVCFDGRPGKQYAAQAARLDDSEDLLPERLLGLTAGEAPDPSIPLRMGGWSCWDGPQIHARFVTGAGALTRGLYGLTLTYREILK